jgi:hypothetical protein
MRTLPFFSSHAPHRQVYIFHSFYYTSHALHSVRVDQIGDEVREPLSPRPSPDTVLDPHYKRARDLTQQANRKGGDRIGIQWVREREKVMVRCGAWSTLINLSPHLSG